VHMVWLEADNAAHIARLDPQTVASIVSELLSLRRSRTGGADAGNIFSRDPAEEGAASAVPAIEAFRETLAATRPALEPTPDLVGEAIEALRAIATRARNARGAIESNQVVDKDVHGSMNWIIERAKAEVAKLEARHAGA